MKFRTMVQEADDLLEVLAGEILIVVPDAQVLRSRGVPVGLEQDDVLVLAATFVLCTALSSKVFRWE